VARLEDVPAPPFWGARALTALPLEEVFAMLDERQLFRLSWGAKAKLGAEWEQLRQEFGARLERMKREALEEPWLAPQSVYGYFPVNGHGNDLIVWVDESRTRELTRFTFPRQPHDPSLCIADFFRPLGQGPDVFGLFVVTIGGEASRRAAELFEAHHYRDYLHFHGLAVETAEATGEHVHRLMRRELRIDGEAECEVAKAVTHFFGEFHGRSFLALCWESCRVSSGVRGR
jgi:5-methyltetrahydrofolate--homocysteine methyltransferase